LAIAYDGAVFRRGSPKKLRVPARGAPLRCGESRVTAPPDSISNTRRAEVTFFTAAHGSQPRAPEGMHQTVASVAAAVDSGPFIVESPAEQAAAVVCASPHSGSRYPERFVRASRLDPLTLRRSEDAFIDELFAEAPRLGAPLIKATFPRAYVDPNRE